MKLHSLDQVLQRTIEAGEKGLPLAAAGRSAASIGQAGWNILDQDAPLPVCVLRRSAMDHNRRVMRAFLDDAGMKLAPHGKTTMAPQLFEFQLEDGAWALTAATPAHLITYRRFGVQRIIYANQLVDPGAIAFVVDELKRAPEFEFYCLVDSVESARYLCEAGVAQGLQRPIYVLIEVGAPYKRCGVRTLEQALALARSVRRMAPALNLAGVEAFEGLFATDAGGVGSVNTLLDLVLDITRQCALEHLFLERPIVTVGGSAFFQIVASRLSALRGKAELVLRGGCYITNDHGMYARAQPALRGEINLPEPLQPALEVWGHVLSRPQPDFAVVAVGKRDISHDIEPPRAVLWAQRGARHVRPLPDTVQTLGLNDQHAMLKIPEEHPLAVGDLVGLGSSHPCTTFDKWKSILVVDDAYNIVDMITTLF